MSQTLIFVDRKEEHHRTKNGGVTIIKVEQPEGKRARRKAEARERRKQKMGVFWQ